MAKRNEFLLEVLMQAFDAVEGVYSGIPQCCVIPYMNGRHGMSLRSEIAKKKNKKQLLKNLELFNYIPCDDCLKNKRVAKLKHNGVSSEGRVLFALIETFAGKKDLGGDCDCDE